MVNRSLRRKQQTGDSIGSVMSIPVVESINGIRESENNSINESTAGSDVDRGTDSDAGHDDNEPNSAKPIGIVEVNPDNLRDFINNDRAGIGSGGSGGSDTGTGKRKYTRRNTGKRTNKETTPNVEALVTMVHTWASVLLKTPELMLSQDESKQLSESYAEFSQYHEVPLLTPKRMSEVNLIGCMLALYGTRFVAIRNRRKNEHNTSNVTPITVRAQVSH